MDKQARIFVSDASGTVVIRPVKFPSVTAFQNTLHLKQLPCVMQTIPHHGHGAILAPMEVNELLHYLGETNALNSLVEEYFLKNVAI